MWGQRESEAVCARRTACSGNSTGLQHLDASEELSDENEIENDRCGQQRILACVVHDCGAREHGEARAGSRGRKEQVWGEKAKAKIGSEAFDKQHPPTRINKERAREVAGARVCELVSARMPHSAQARCHSKRSGECVFPLFFASPSLPRSHHERSGLQAAAGCALCSAARISPPLKHTHSCSNTATPALRDPFGPPLYHSRDSTNSPTRPTYCVGAAHKNF